MRNGNVAAEELVYFLNAGFSFFYVSTQEMYRCIERLRKGVDEAEVNGRKLYKTKVWDMLGDLDASGSPRIEADPLTFLLDEVDRSEVGTVYFCKNFNWFLYGDFGDKPKYDIATVIQNNAMIYSSKPKRKAIVIVSDGPMETEIPTCLQQYFRSIEFGLPNQDELREVLDKIVATASKNEKFKKPSKKDIPRIIDAALGLTLQDAENAFVYCIIKHKELREKVVDRIKSETVKKTAGVEYVEFEETFENLKGYKQIKLFSTTTIKDPLAKGILLLGPPGTGKTLFCKCLGNEAKMRVLLVEMAQFQGGIVGETEKKYAAAIAVIKAMSGSNGVIVIVDE